MAPSQSAHSAAVRPRRILLVDDSEDACASLAALLEMHGHDVQVAHDGTSALERASGFVPDIVLLDIGLPAMSGLEVARHLRAMPQLAAIILIALTGHGGAADRERTRDAGFDHHFTKPLDFPALIRLLSELHHPISAAESTATGNSSTG